MSKTYTIYLVTTFILYSLTTICKSQNNVDFDFTFEINPCHTGLTVTKDQISSAITLKDLNKFYKPEWVASYISVEVTTIRNGNRKKSQSRDDFISSEQRQQILNSDIGSDIDVVVKYMPNNSLAFNNVQTENFSFKINPDNPARFKSGYDDLTNYLSNSIYKKLKINQFEQHKLTVLKFAVNEDGQVVNVNIIEESNEKTIDNLLIEAICNMPKWTPASYLDGTKVLQEFYFSIGDHNSCIVSLHNIRSQ